MLKTLSHFNSILLANVNYIYNSIPPKAFTISEEKFSICFQLLLFFSFFPVLRATAERKGREVMTSIVLPSFDWLTSELDPKNGGQFQGHVWEHNKAVALARIPLCDMPPKQCLRFSG